jgi:hypothetical protein
MVIDKVMTIGFLYFKNKFFMEYKTFLYKGVVFMGNKKPPLIGEGVSPTILSSKGVIYNYFFICKTSEYGRCSFNKPSGVIVSDLFILSSAHNGWRFV